MNTEPLTDAEAFYNFLGDQLNVGGQQESLDRLLSTWREQREHKQTVTAVAEGACDAEAGRMRPLRDILNELSDGGSQSHSANA